MAVLCVVAAIVLAAGVAAPAAEPAAGVVCNVKVLSDKVPDVSSLAAWKKAFIRDGMTEKEKALAVWQSVVTFQHQDGPPLEFLQAENTVLDTIKIFNVYGYSFCGVAASHVETLGRYAGLKVRGWTICAHVVPDVMWDAKWHLLDASLITYFPQAGGDLAGVEDIVAGVKGWYEKHPDLRKNDAGLRKFMAEGGWKANGPAVLSQSPAYDDRGWLPAATHGWYSTMQEYDGSTLFPYESGYSQGYRVNVRLRAGERLTRNWSNKGLDVNMGVAGGPGCMKESVGKGFLRYTPKFGDLAPGRVGNGTHEYDVPLAGGAFRGGALAAENLASKSEDQAAPALHVKDAAAPGRYVVRMPSSYVYLTGSLAFQAAVGEGGSIAVSFSDNNGLDWQDLATVTKAGAQTIDLSDKVLRRYDYQLQFVLKGNGTGLDSLKITHDVQHSQRPLPALDAGDNTITFSADAAENTVTIEGSTDPKNKGKQLLYTDFHPQAEGIGTDMLIVGGSGKGQVTFPIETPGDMKRLRVGIYYRVRDARDAWTIEASFDGGKTFAAIGKCEGPFAGFGKYFEFADVPAGTKKALVRLAGTAHNATMIHNLRIDADYTDPHGGFAPVKVTYVWEEGGQEKRDVHVAKAAQETYKITCATKPVMKSLVVELAE